MKIIELAVKRPIGVCTLFMVLILFGFISLSKLKISMLPDITYPKLTIITLFQNVPPKEIETLVTAPIEETIMSVKGIKSVRSISRQGISIVIPAFRWGTDLDIASVDVREKLDMIKNILPDEISKPIISRIDPTATPIIGLAVFWKNRDATFIKRLIEKEIKPELERIDGVAKVSVKGGVEEEIKVDIDLDKLNAYNLSLDDVLNFLRNASYNFPAGDIIEGKKEYLIRVDGEFKSINDIGDTIVGRSERGAIVKLNEIAKIYSGIKERTSYFLLDGEEGIGLEIIKETQGNDIEISKNINKAIGRINEKFNSFLNIILIFDSSNFIKESINGLFISVLLAIGITFFVMFLFMKNYRLPLLIVITVPVSILITFILMFLSKMNLNVMSLGGLALGIGMLVDCTIVVIEEIEGKLDRIEIYKSTSRVTISIFASTLTTIVVFVPLIFVRGVAGALFSQLGLTITFSLISSIFVSILLIPVLYILILKGERAIDPEWFLKLKMLFKKILIKNFKKPSNIIVISVVSFIISILIFLFLKKEFMPVVDTGEFYLKLNFRSGTPIEESKIYTTDVSKKILLNKNVEHCFASVGYDSNDPFALLQDEVGVNISQIRVILKKKRKDNVFKIVDELSQSLRIREDVVTVFEIPRNMIAELLNLEKSDFVFELSTLDEEKLDNYAFEYKKKLEKSNIFLKIDTSNKEGKPQIKVSFDNEALAGSGISSKAIYDIMATAIRGSKATTFRRDDDQIDIKVILEESDRSELTDIARLNLKSEEGLIPIFPFLKEEKENSPSKILRKNQKRYIKFTGNFKINKDRGIREIKKINENFIKSNSNTYITGGESEEEMNESFRELFFAFLLSIFLVYAILASQFESLLRPFLIMFSVPISFFGSFFLLLVLNKTINLNSVIGLIILVGIAVNNAIILFDRFNYKIETCGIEPLFALYYGSINRFKPILMTSCTTIFGLVPMAIGIGRGAEIQRSLALAVIGGLTVSMILILFLMPNLYRLSLKNYKKK